MSHIVPILCLIIFIGFTEFRLKEEFRTFREEFDRLKKDINYNKETIHNHINNGNSSSE